MRSFISMPKEPIMEGLLAKSTVKADETAIHRFANLADRLGFESPEIAALKNNPDTARRQGSEQSRPLLVTAGPGEGKKQGCGLPRKQAYEGDSKVLFTNNLHDEGKEQGESITSFFVLKSRYLAFFGRPTMTGVNAGIDNLNLLPRSEPILRGSLQYSREEQKTLQDISEKERLERFLQEQLQMEYLQQEHW
jgi:hypothetical protein